MRAVRVSSARRREDGFGADPQAVELEAGDVEGGAQGGHGVAGGEDRRTIPSMASQSLGGPSSPGSQHVIGSGALTSHGSSGAQASDERRRSTVTCRLRRTHV